MVASPVPRRASVAAARAVAVTLLLALGVAGSAQAAIVFDGSPGNGPPPATLGGYAMTAFPTDTRPVFDSVTSVPSPAGGQVSFSDSMSHRRVGAVTGWSSVWSHGYTGDVYFTPDLTRTLTLPAQTKAFSFSTESGLVVGTTVTAVAQDGTSSGAIPVGLNGQAKFIGFSATGSDTIATIAVTYPSNSGGFAVGEFRINIPLTAQLDDVCAQVTSSLPRLIAAPLCQQLKQARDSLLRGQGWLARMQLAEIANELRFYQAAGVIAPSVAGPLIARVNAIRLAI